MEIGACGIACGVCALFARGICPGCVAGNDAGVSEKLDAHKKKLGSICPVLKCAVANKVGYCLRDCDEFPCDVLYRGFPYSKRFLNIFKEGVTP